MKNGIPYSSGSGRWLTGMAGAWLALGSLTAQETFRITRVEPVADRLELSWEGDPALDYFEVQQWDGQFPEYWKPVFLTAQRSVSMEREGLQGLLRIAAIERPGPAAPISDARRHEILDAVAEQIGALPGEDAEADAVAVAAILRSHPDLEAVSLSADGTVSARFRDGRPLVIIDNRPPADPSEYENGVDKEFFNGGGAAGRAGVSLAGGRSPRSVSGTTGLPVSRRAVLFQPTGIGIDAPMLQTVVPAFNQAGYNVQGGEASLANFLAVSSVGNDIGVFYVDSHGAVLNLEILEEDVPVRHLEFFVLGTSTLSTPEIDALYHSLYGDTFFFEKSGELGETIYVQYGSRTNKGLKRTKSPSYYAITSEFVRKRWGFSRNSLVVFDTCYSAAAGAASFRETCYARGAALYAGWTDKVADAWAFNRTTPPLFELLLGGSHIYHTEPPQRPFNLDTVLDYLDARGLRVDQTAGFPGARFTCFAGPAANGSFQLLNPAMLRMGVTESTDEVYVQGHFDPEAPATVRVEGGATAEIPAKSVTKTMVTFPLPADSSPSAGDVTIIQQERESNTIPLSEWTIDATLVKHFAPGLATPSATMEFQLRFRVDAHEFRLKPFTDPVFLDTGSLIAMGTTGRVVSASGTHVYPGENQGTLDWSLDAPVNVPFADLRGTLNIAADRSVKLDASLRAGDVMTVTQRNGSGQVVLEYKREPGTGVFPPGETSLDPSTYRIKAGSGSAAGDSGTFEWKDAEPRFPPAGDFAR